MKTIIYTILQDCITSDSQDWKILQLLEGGHSVLVAAVKKMCRAVSQFKTQAEVKVGTASSV